MKKIYFIILTLIAFSATLSSCKNYYEEPQEIKYNCILEQENFITAVQPIIEDEGFTIKNADLKRGFIIAEREVKDKDSNQVTLNLSIRFEKETKNYYVTPSSIILPRENHDIRYYSESRMPDEYKAYFDKLLERLKNFCKGGYYPNRP